VLGRVPETLAAQAAALDEADRQQQQQQAADSAAAADGEGSSSSSSSVADDFLPGVPRPLAAAVDAALKLDDETLAAVSKAIMGRLDIVDLVGKNTAYEVAERVSVLLVCWKKKKRGYMVCTGNYVATNTRKQRRAARSSAEKTGCHP
jgi:cell division protease FtsH